MLADLREIVKRLEFRVKRLEELVSGKPKKSQRKENNSAFKGATGGIRFLVSKSFFDRRRSFGEVKEALASNGYHYSKQAVQTPLSVLSKPGSLLVSFREGGKKVYAKRK